MLRDVVSAECLLQHIKLQIIQDSFLAIRRTVNILSLSLLLSPFSLASVSPLLSPFSFVCLSPFSFVCLWVLSVSRLSFFSLISLFVFVYLSLFCLLSLLSVSLFLLSDMSPVSSSLCLFVFYLSFFLSPVSSSFYRIYFDPQTPKDGAPIDRLGLYILTSMCRFRV